MDLVETLEPMMEEPEWPKVAGGKALEGFSDTGYVDGWVAGRGLFSRNQGGDSIQVSGDEFGGKSPR